jgi:hypothetical protein
MSIRLGIDFDNTIISYEGVFHRAGVERGLILESVGRAKDEVRNYLRQDGRENDWTELQGYVYGEMVTRCEPYPGVLAFFRSAAAAGIELFIVSHKTRHPYMGPSYDLHDAAKKFIAAQGFESLGLIEERVFFELTKADKLARIGTLGCTHFVDDLPEFLAESEFPAATKRILFDPAALHEGEARFTRIRNWSELPAAIGAPEIKIGG